MDHSSHGSPGEKDGSLVLGAEDTGANALTGAVRFLRKRSGETSDGAEGTEWPSTGRRPR